MLLSLLLLLKICNEKLIAKNKFSPLTESIYRFETEKFSVPALGEKLLKLVTVT